MTYDSRNDTDAIEFTTLCILCYAEQKNIKVDTVAKLFNENKVTGFLFNNYQIEGGLCMSNIIEDIDMFISNRQSKS